MNLQNKINSGFKTPDDFFENFEKNMISKVLKEKPVLKINFWNKNKKLIISAAAITVVSTINMYNNLNFNTVINTDIIVYEDILQLSNWENELTDEEIAEIKNDLLFDKNTLEEDLLNLDYTELN
jgi:hypothetical protein